MLPCLDFQSRQTPHRFTPARSGRGVRRRFAGLLLAALVGTGGAGALATGVAHAAEAPAEPVAGDAGVSEHLRLSGFGTFGLAHNQSARGWRFSREPIQADYTSATTWTVDSRLGVQANWALMPKLEAVGQLVLRRRPSGDFNRESVEWAFLAWRPTPEWAVRVGRFSPDIFLHADVRNVGFALPWVRPNVDFYGWMPFNSADGADLARDWRSDVADWQLRVSATSARADVFGLAPERSTPSRVSDMLALSLSREAGPLLLKATLVDARTNVGVTAGMQPVFDGLDALAQVPIPELATQAQALKARLLPGGHSRYLGLGLQWDQGPWLVHAEYSRIQMARGSLAGRHGYASLGRRLGQVMLYGMLSASRAERPPVELPQQWADWLAPAGAVAVQDAMTVGAGAVLIANSIRFQQRTAALGLRWNLHARAALKLQFDRTWVDANGPWAWQRSGIQPAQNNVISAAVDFVF